MRRISELVRKTVQNSRISFEVREVDETMAYVSDSNVLIDRRTIFIASSRLGRKLDEMPRLFEALLTLATKLDSDRDVFLTGEGTTCDLMVRRLGELFQIPVLSMRCVNEREVARLDGQTILNMVSSNQVAVFDTENRGVDFSLGKIAKEVVVLSVRKGGNLHASISHRLGSGFQTRILLEPTLTRTGLANELMAQGATGWILFREDPVDEESHAETAKVCNPADFNIDEYLLHWTRRRVGPWPDQSENEFLDSLIFQTGNKDRRQVASLRRILATNRIVATNELTRDARPVVCFSDISFAELLQRRVFRSHMGRWDFEPFGVAIRKDWLKGIGCRQVIYGNNSRWANLSDSDRPFFQMNDEGAIDWSHEKEWRVVGDVDLRRVSADAAVVFVPTEQDATEISGFCKWPIVVLGESTGETR